MKLPNPSVHSPSGNRTIDRFGIQPQDIYNFGETRFEIGVDEDQWIVTQGDLRKSATGARKYSNQESLSVVETVSTDAFSIPPMIILTEAQIQQSWCENILDQEQVAVTKDGRFNHTIILQWLQHFEESTHARTRGSHRLLLCDGFGSYLNFETVKFCEKNKIIPLLLPPHSNELLQPLDVGLSDVYQHHHDEAVRAVTAIGRSGFSKETFLAALASIRQKTLTKSTI